LEVGLELRLSILGGGGPRQLPSLSVRFGLADVSVDATGRLAFDADGIAAMQLRQLANCTFRQVLEGSLVTAAASASLERLTIDGGAGGHAALARPVQLKLPGALEQLVSSAVNEWARGLLLKLRQRATCPAPVDYLPSIVDLTTSQTVREIDEIVDDLVGPQGNHTVEPLERFVLSFADDLKKLVGLHGGALRLPARFVDLWVTDPKVGQVGVQLSNLSLSGLDAAFAVELLEPAAPHLLTHTAGAGGAAPLRVAVHMDAYLGGRWHAFDVVLELRNISLELATPLRFDRNALGSLSLGQVLESPSCLAAPLTNLTLDAAGSRLSTPPPRVGGVTLALRSSLHGEGAVQLPDLLPALVLLLPGFSHFLDASLQEGLGWLRAKCAHTPFSPPAPPDARASISRVAAAVIAVAMFATPLLLLLAACALQPRLRLRRRAAREERRRKSSGLSRQGADPLHTPAFLGGDALLGAPAQATLEPAYTLREQPNGEDDAAPADAAAAVGVGGGADADAAAAEWRPDAAAAGGSPAAPLELIAAPLMEEEDDESDSEGEELAAAWAASSAAGAAAAAAAAAAGGGNKRPCGNKRRPLVRLASTSLAQQPMYRGSVWAWLVPGTIFVTFALFLVSAIPALAAGATVDLLLNVTGEPVELLNIFSFTLPGSIHDSWAAGVYPLSLLIALLSGLWPYVKLLLMLACWWA